MSLYERIYKAYGKPMAQGGKVLLPVGFEGKHMAMWYRDTLGWFPAPRIYANKVIHKPLTDTLAALQAAGLHQEIRTFDGCFNPRLVRGSATAYSMHTWGIAIDLNAATNPLGGPVRFSPSFLQVWREHGWTCGADFPRLDGMHFEYTRHLQA